MSTSFMTRRSLPAPSLLRALTSLEVAEDNLRARCRVRGLVEGGELEDSVSRVSVADAVHEGPVGSVFALIRAAAAVTAVGGMTEVQCSVRRRVLECMVLEHAQVAPLTLRFTPRPPRPEPEESAEEEEGGDLEADEEGEEEEEGVREGEDEIIDF